MSATEYLLIVPGLDLLNERGCLDCAQTLLDPLTQIANDVLALLGGRRSDPVSVEVKDALAAPGWPKGWDQRASVTRYTPSGEHRSGKIHIDYTFMNPRDGDGWSASLKFPGVALWVDEDSVLELSAQFNSDTLTLAFCNLPDEWLAKLIAAIGRAFECDVTVDTKRACAWRVPPDQPTFVYCLTAKPLVSRSLSKLFHDLRAPAAEVARGMLELTVPGAAVEVSDYVVSDVEWEQVTATARSASGPEARVELSYLAEAKHLSCDVRLLRASYPREWPRRGGLAVGFRPGQPEPLCIVKTLTFPDAWVEPLIALLERSFATSCTLTQIQPMLDYTEQESPCS